MRLLTLTWINKYSETTGLYTEALEQFGKIAGIDDGYRLARTSGYGPGNGGCR